MFDHSPSFAQAATLLAVAEQGSIHRAAKALGKSHTSVLYLLRTLEELVGFPVLDRSGYRVSVSRAGQRLLPALQQYLTLDRQFQEVVREIRTGWEPTLRIVFDGVVDSTPIVRFIGSLAQRGVPTHVDARTEFLSGVEGAFSELSADIMIAVLPPKDINLISVPLPPFEAWLVASKSHPLTRGLQSAPSLEAQVLLTVRGSDPRLQLSTAHLLPSRTISFHDFGSKRLAILEGIGYGWMPAPLVEHDVARGRLRRIEWEAASTHTFRPRLYHRRKGLGPAGKGLVAALRK